PYYDSLLVKVTAHGLRFLDAARRMERSLQEFRVRGVKTNIPFLLNLVTHPDFLAGRFTTHFLDETPELFQLPVRQDRATKLLTYSGETIVNGNPEIVGSRPWAVRRKDTATPGDLVRSPVPGSGPLPTAQCPLPTVPPGTRDKFMELGPDKFARWVRNEKR